MNPNDEPNLFHAYSIGIHRRGVHGFMMSTHTQMKISAADEKCMRTLTAGFFDR